MKLTFIASFAATDLAGRARCVLFICENAPGSGIEVATLVPSGVQLVLATGDQGSIARAKQAWLRVVATQDEVGSDVGTQRADAR